MKPKIKAQKGWRYRVIIANSKGEYVFDDVWHEEQVIVLAESLIKELVKKQEKKEGEEKE